APPRARGPHRRRQRLVRGPARSRGISRNTNTVPALLDGVGSAGPAATHKHPNGKEHCMNHGTSPVRYELVVRINGTHAAFSPVGRARTSQPKVCTSVSLFVFEDGRCVL